MKPEVVLELLENTADQLGIRVSYESLTSTVVHGGLCKVKGAYRIIVDKRATAEERVITLASPLPALGEDVVINATSPPFLPQRVQGIVVRAGAGVPSLFTVDAGTSQLDDVALEDAGVTVDLGARLVFAQSMDGTYAEGIDGGGSVEKRGTTGGGVSRIVMPLITMRFDGRPSASASTAEIACVTSIPSTTRPSCATASSTGARPGS